MGAASRQIPTTATTCAVELDREVRAQDVVRGQGDADRLGLGDRMEPGRDRSISRGREVGRQLAARAVGVGGVGEEDRAVGRPDFDAQDLAGGDDRLELRLEGGGARRGEAAGLEVGRDEIAVGEAADGRGIRADDRAEHRLRRLRRDDDRLTQRRQTDDHQEEAEDDDQEDRPLERPERHSEQGPTPGDGP